MNWVWTRQMMLVLVQNCFCAGMFIGEMYWWILLRTLWDIFYVVSQRAKAYLVHILSEKLNKIFVIFFPFTCVFSSYDFSSFIVMACCLTAPSHCLNLCWLIIRGFRAVHYYYCYCYCRCHGHCLNHCRLLLLSLSSSSSSSSSSSLLLLLLQYHEHNYHDYDYQDQYILLLSLLSFMFKV